MTRNVRGKEKIGCVFDEYDKMCPKRVLKKTFDKIITIRSKTLIEQYYCFFYDDYIIKYCNLPKKKSKYNLPKEYFMVFPSASMELKKWPIERYAEIVNKIFKKTNLTLVLCGTKSDKNDNDDLVKIIDNSIPYIDLIGKTSLLEFIDIIDNAKFVITNDTSTYHIAVINQTPVAIISGAYTYDRYVSYDFTGCEEYKRPYVIVNKTDCMNCYNRCSKMNKECKIWPCLEEITVNDAWKVINKMIDDNLNIEEVKTK